jgi:hypothetical protein
VVRIIIVNPESTPLNDDMQAPFLLHDHETKTTRFTAKAGCKHIAWVLA